MQRCCLFNTYRPCTYILMSADHELELYRVHRAAQEKYTYFLLAAAGAAIGFAVTQSQTAAFEWPQLPLGLAVLLWALSFFFGCRHLNYVEATLYANMDLLKVQAGMHPEVGAHPQMQAAAAEGIRSAMGTNSIRSARFADWQFRFFVLGAVFFIAWHVVGMYLRTP